MSIVVATVASASVVRPAGGTVGLRRRCGAVFGREGSGAGLGASGSGTNSWPSQTAHGTCTTDLGNCNGYYNGTEESP